jgi:hypothetical protein
MLKPYLNLNVLKWTLVDSKYTQPLFYNQSFCEIFL